MFNDERILYKDLAIFCEEQIKECAVCFYLSHMPILTKIGGVNFSLMLYGSTICNRRHNRESLLLSRLRLLLQIIANLLQMLNHIL